MEITITWQSLITAGAIAGALATLIGLAVKLIRWIDRQQAQDDAIAALQAHHNEDIAAIKTEQTLLTYGILACLKGLKEQGCNGPVTEAINTIEKHINKEAHK